ncbi:MAG: aminoacyl-tRNA hydrolase [Thermoanaerobaculia bacterium]|nr:aminoacyl-tRNA hydrolase [Thermoanaerobaculia bacterium]
MGSRLILGLGNPGAEYVQTRHNVGFWVVEELARRRQLEWSSEACRILLASEVDLYLGKPQTFMNRSGLAAQCLVEHQNVGPEDLLIVYDDIHLPVGRLRLRGSGGPGGHRGLESVIETLQTDAIARLRLGVGASEEAPTGQDLVDFVLGEFDDEERKVVEEMVCRAADACESWLEAGVEVTMNRFNG